MDYVFECKNKCFSTFFNVQHIFIENVFLSKKKLLHTNKSIKRQTNIIYLFLCKTEACNSKIHPMHDYTKLSVIVLPPHVRTGSVIQLSVN